jgi:hypothetical protein|nr:MAG TPA: hypothetical protein [Caudoviricetes sp.]
MNNNSLYTDVNAVRVSGIKIKNNKPVVQQVNLGTNTARTKIVKFSNGANLNSSMDNFSVAVTEELNRAYQHTEKLSDKK